MVTFEKMLPQEREICAALAARAFNDYEYFTDYVPDDKKRSRFLYTMLQIEVKLNDGSATFFTAKDEGKIVAVAMLCPPEYKTPSDMEYMNAGFDKCFLKGGRPHGTTWKAKPESPAIGLQGRCGI